jgi:hypothetical protein
MDLLLFMALPFPVIYLCLLPAALGGSQPLGPRRDRVAGRLPHGRIGLSPLLGGRTLTDATDGTALSTCSPSAATRSPPCQSWYWPRSPSAAAALGDLCDTASETRAGGLDLPAGGKVYACGGVTVHPGKEMARMACPSCGCPCGQRPCPTCGFPLALRSVRQRGGSGSSERTGQPRQDRQVSVKLDRSRRRTRSGSKRHWFLSRPFSRSTAPRGSMPRRARGRLALLRTGGRPRAGGPTQERPRSRLRSTT